MKSERTCASLTLKKRFVYLVLHTHDELKDYSNQDVNGHLEKLPRPVNRHETALD